MKATPPLRIVLVDDDEDDHFIFAKTLNEIQIPTILTSITESENLMDYLLNLYDLPDVIFLDLNMPRKNGCECLTEIKQHAKLKHIPIIIYSTSYHKDILDILYAKGAIYSIRKSPSGKQTRESIEIALDFIIKNNILQPDRKKFTLGFIEYK
jgi:CheY-like chemotaxis protein